MESLKCSIIPKEPGKYEERKKKDLGQIKQILK